MTHEALVKVLRDNRVIPVAQFDDPGRARRIAELLHAAAFSVIEITLRTDEAYDCIAAIRSAIPSMTVGAGSVLTTEACNRAIDAGASFCVAPGMDPALIDLAAQRGTPFIPGVATPTELTAALSRCSVVKIFPASLLGGPEYIKAVAAPFRLKSFHLMPTGGITEKNYRDYLAADRVIAVGMSWLVDNTLVQKGDDATLAERMDVIARGRVQTA